MSRSGYSDDWFDNWSQIRWRGAVASAMNGKRGQAFLREMRDALDALPVKRLVVEALVDVDRISLSHWGLHEYESVCALGAVGKARGVDMHDIDPEDYGRVATTFGIAEAMTQEIVYTNDEHWTYNENETPEMRFVRVRKWVVGMIKE